MKIYKENERQTNGAASEKKKKIKCTGCMAPECEHVSANRAHMNGKSID